MSDVEAQEHYDRFFEDVFVEMEEKVSVVLSAILQTYLCVLMVYKPCLNKILWIYGQWCYFKLYIHILLLLAYVYSSYHIRINCIFQRAL